MDVFKLGLRNILGITLPGVILVMATSYILWDLIILWSLSLASFSWLKEQQFLTFALLFVISYLLGNLMRLGAADNLDKKSGQYLQKQHFEKYPNSASEDELEKTRKALLSKNNDQVKIPKGFYLWIGFKESFPYHLWEFRKFELYHPPEVLNFFKTYKECMFGGQGKEFFNYCKMVILGSGNQTLKDEIYLAEAISRFFAGTYTALNIAFWFLFGFGVFPILLFKIPLFANSNYTLKTVLIHIFLTYSLVSIVYFMKQNIVKRFRRIRLKEVDTVYDAFYLVHKHADSCPQCSGNTIKSQNNKFIEREKILREAFIDSQKNSGDTSPVSWERLVSLMKKRSKFNAYLSSIYFAGKEGDHPYFLQNDKIAVGLSVLPEDSKKAGKSKLHPHQHEVLVVLDGSILLEIKQNGKTIQKKLKAGELFVINKEQCHRISPIDNKDATYLFVKNNPAVEPRSLDCEL